MARKILIQLDCDPHPSTFDAVVAVDAGVDVLLQYHGVTSENVVPLVHGAMFTRGGADLASTAIFVGGADVTVAESVFERIGRTFFGNVRVSAMLDPSGANTTASAAVVAAGKHLRWDDPSAPPVRAVVLGGTGPVGQRVVYLLARKRVFVSVVSRSISRAEDVCMRLRTAAPDVQVEPVGTDADAAAFDVALAAADLIIAAGAAGKELLDHASRVRASRARVLIDLNAVPPAGIAGVAAGDKAKPDGGAVLYGALGVGGTKMKIHRKAIQRLFESNDAWLDAEQLLSLGEAL